MACSKYTLTNTGSTIVNFSYRRCDDSLWDYQVELVPNQTKNIWVINGTYTVASSFKSSISLIDEGTFPSTAATNTPTPSNSPTPTPMVTSTVTPTPSSTNSVTSTPTPSPTPTITPTSSISCETLGRSSSFVVLANSTVTNSGNSVITGDLGLTPGTSVTGFPPGTLVGTQYINNSTAANALTDANDAYDCLIALTPTGSVSGDIGGTTITAGTYSVSSSLGITGTVTLDGGGDSDAVFIFQIPSTFIPATNAVISLTNGTQAGNVYWLVGSSATLSTNATIAGNIIAQTSITVNSGVELIGRAFALTAAVTIDNSDITGASCTINPCAG